MYLLIISNLYGCLHKSCNGIPVRAEDSHLQSLKNGSKTEGKNEFTVWIHFPLVVSNPSHCEGFPQGWLGLSKSWMMQLNPIIYCVYLKNSIFIMMKTAIIESVRFSIINNKGNLAWFSSSIKYYTKTPKQCCLGVCLYSDKFKYIEGGHQH